MDKLHKEDVLVPFGITYATLSMRKGNDETHFECA